MSLKNLADAFGEDLQQQATASHTLAARHIEVALHSGQVRSWRAGPGRAGEVGSGRSHMWLFDWGRCSLGEGARVWVPREAPS